LSNRCIISEFLNSIRVTQIAKTTLRPFGTKVHNIVMILVKVFLIVVLQHAQFDCYSQPIITRQSCALFPRRLHPLVASRGIYRLQYLVNSEIRGVENEPYTFILCVALLLRIGRVASLNELYRRFLQPYRQNANIVLEIRPQPSPSKSIPIHYSPTIPPLDSTVGVCTIFFLIQTCTPTCTPNLHTNLHTKHSSIQIIHLISE
jgi:hypothetical protein